MNNSKVSYKIVRPKLQSIIKQPNDGLFAYLEHVRTGNREVYQTPFARHNGGTQKVLADWIPHLEQLSSSWPTLFEFEKDLAAKVGPLSVMLPLSKRVDDVLDYYRLCQSGQDLRPEAINAVLKEFKAVGGQTLRSQQRTIDLMKKSTNSGLPFFTKRRNVVDKTAPCYIMDSLQVLDHDHERYELAAVLGWRGQEGGPKPSDVKQRVVWMFPFALNIEELRFYQPFIEACQAYELVPAWNSMDLVDKRITSLFDTKGVDDYVVCTDFSKFDQHFSPCMQKAAKTIMSNLMRRNEDTRYWLESVFPQKYSIPMLLSPNRMVVGRHGMGSGSGGTNCDETLAHRALQWEAAINRNKPLNPNSMCLGDDGVLTFPGITVEDVMQTYTAHGQEMNADKQYVSKHDCIYLRRWHHDHYRVNGVCVGVYATCRALGRLCEQERFYDSDIWSAKMVALRQLSILENVKFHPLREEFVSFCMQRDKYRLGLDIPGFLSDLEQITKRAIDLMPDFLGYTKSMNTTRGDDFRGISQWWIVKYLKSL